MKFIVYRPDDGEILRSVDCPEVLADQQAGPGEAVLASEANELTHHVVDGTPVAYTPEQASLKASRPRRPCAWSNETHSWVDMRDLAQIKADRWAAMKAARDAFEFGGFTWDGATFDSDPASQSRIQGAAQLALLALQAGQPFSVQWTTADNSVRELSGHDVIQVGVALGAHVLASHAHGRQLRASIEAAQSSEELEQVAWQI